MKVGFLLAALSVPMVCQASDAQEDPCTTYGKVMGSFMNARQHGVPKSRIYQIVDEEKEMVKTEKVKLKKAVDFLYTRPIYPTREQKLTAANNARENSFMSCAAETMHIK